VPRLTRRNRKRLRSVLVHASLILITGVLAMPFVWLVSTSLKRPVEMLLRVPRWVPNNPTLDNFTYVLTQTSVPSYFRNSLLVASATALAAVVMTSLGAYALSRYRFHGKAVYIVFILTAQMFPAALFLTPLFIVLKNTGLINSHLGLIVAYATFSIPFCTWLLKSYFDSIPIDLEESALTEGGGRLQVMRYITLPLAAPGLVAALLFAFLLGWQEFLFAFTYIQSDDLRTLPPGIGLLYSRSLGGEYGHLTAMSVIVTVPVVMLFMGLQRYVVQGLTAGSVKG
jgi:ABC-type glycerol-3-phosphate transport system permease component